MSTGAVTRETISFDFARKFLGGTGFAAKVLFDELEPGIDALGPANKLLFMTGPVTGVPIAGNSCTSVTAKSPESGGWAEGYACSYLGAELKRAGVDGIIVEGSSANPVYIWIYDGKAEIRDASMLWGKTTYETMVTIKKLFASSVEVACIGPAAENLVKYCKIIFDYGSTGGRGGLGTVMGSKKLKAIVVHGEDEIKVAKTKDMIKMIRRWTALREKLPYQWELGMYGTAWKGYPPDMPTRNFQSGFFPNSKALSSETLISKGIKRGRYACFACHVGCKQFCKLDDGSYKGVYVAPEAEPTGSLGWLLGNDDAGLITYVGDLCDLYSIDVESLGPIIAFAMECYQRGILTQKDIGFKLNWGDHDGIIKIVKLIAERKGIGDLLAEDLKRISEKVGKNSSDFALHVKGLGISAGGIWDADGLLQFATCDRGANHGDAHGTLLSGRPPGPKRTVKRRTKSIRKLVISRDIRAVLNSMIVCRFAWPHSIPEVLDSKFLSVDDLSEVLNYVTGFEFDLNRLMLIGERISNLRRAFNVREGFSRKDDTLPKRYFEPIPDGGHKGWTLTKEEFDSMLDEYYRLRGWDVKTGIPTPEKLVSLGLPEAADQLSQLVDDADKAKRRKQ